MNYVRIFETLDLDGLTAFVERGQEENLHLDFKLPSDPVLTRDDRRMFARALSGFANSSGGIIVWGVDARKSQDGVDCAVGLKPVERVALLLTRLNSVTGEAADPLVPGVLHRVIETDGGRGFALTLVPETESGPHMAKLGEDRYYKRSGDSFYKMEHYDIADMFGRRRRPKLRVCCRIVGRGNNAEVHLGLSNEGRATARAPFFAFSCNSTLQRSDFGLDGNRNEGLTFLRSASSGRRWAYSGTDFAIHPGMTHDVASLSLGIPARPAPTEDVAIEYTVACEDQPAQEGTIVIPIADLRNN